MVAKEWKMLEVGTIGNTFNIIWWLKKGDNNSDNKLELYKAHSLDGKDWGVAHRSMVTKNFKTKTEAMKFARTWMGKH